MKKKKVYLPSRIERDITKEEYEIMDMIKGPKKKKPKKSDEMNELLKKVANKPKMSDEEWEDAVEEISETVSKYDD